MAEELESLWQKLTVTDEEEVSVNLGKECTRATNERENHCLVMKVLSRRGIMLDALRKNLRMLWKPNKSIQISLIDEEIYLIEFDDEKDKRRVMDMSPWHYEKQLVLLQCFEGDKDPKDILFQWSPFWVQMYNLPLKHRTKETGLAIGTSLGEVVEVDVADSGVQWGKCLRVRVKIDVTRRLIRGRKLKIEDGEDRWVLFKYERLPNFCYKCGMLDHDLKDCPNSKGECRNGGLTELQYGAWMRGDPVKRSVWESHLTKKNGGEGFRGKSIADEHRIMTVHSPRCSMAGSEKGMSELQCGRERTGENTPKGSEMGVCDEKNLQENSNGRKVSKIHTEDLPILVKDGEDRALDSSGKDGIRLEETKSGEKEHPMFKFKIGPTGGLGEAQVDLDPASTEEGPMAMTYEMDSGWVAEPLGPSSGHWKRRARVGQAKGKEKLESPAKIKRSLLSSSVGLDQNDLGRKKRKVEKKGDDGNDEEKGRDGGVAVAAVQHRRAT